MHKWSFRSCHAIKLVDNTAKVSELVEKGVVIQGIFTTVSTFTNLATQVMISKVPPFRNMSLLKELSWYGQLVSPSGWSLWATSHQSQSTLFVTVER